MKPLPPMPDEFVEHWHERRAKLDPTVRAFGDAMGDTPLVEWQYLHAEMADRVSEEWFEFFPRNEQP